MLRETNKSSFTLLRFPTPTHSQTHSQKTPEMSPNANNQLAPIPSLAKNIKEEGVWDVKVQEFHGGQDWRSCENFLEDFSVTTNALGAPAKAIAAAQQAVLLSHHYPPANQEPAKSYLAKFLWPNSAGYNERLLLGNGASELIDLVCRIAPPGAFKPGPWKAQYREYERAAKNHGRQVLAAGEEQAALVCLVNPCNPTGDYWGWERVMEWLKVNVMPGGVAVIDESMQPWLSPRFREDSFAGQPDLATTLLEKHNIQLYVIHSWTKLWSCTGLRLGSVVTPSPAHTALLKSKQVPWSVNTPALAFLQAAAQDEEYLQETWEKTPLWRAELVQRCEQRGWEVQGASFLSWVWVKVGDVQLVQSLVKLARRAGVPVRDGSSGYEHDEFIRIAVRSPRLTAVLFEEAWSVENIKTAGKDVGI